MTVTTGVQVGQVYRLQGLSAVGRNEPSTPDYDMLLVVGLSADGMVRLFPWSEANREPYYSPVAVPIERVRMLVTDRIWALTPDPVDDVARFMSEYQSLKAQRAAQNPVEAPTV